MVHPSLTTIAFDYEYAGKLAAISLSQLVENKTIPKILHSRYTLKSKKALTKYKGAL